MPAPACPTKKRPTIDLTRDTEVRRVYIRELRRTLEHMFAEGHTFIVLHGNAQEGFEEALRDALALHGGETPGLCCFL